MSVSVSCLELRYIVRLFVLNFIQISIDFSHQPADPSRSA